MFKQSGQRSYSHADTRKIWTSTKNQENLFANDFGSNPLLLPEQSYNNFLFFKEKKKIGGEQTKQSGICL